VSEIEVAPFCSISPSANNKYKIENNKSENCPGQESNLHEPKPTSPSSWRVCQFRHPGELYHLLFIIYD
jgi:hypothetical protein